MQWAMMGLLMNGGSEKTALGEGYDLEECVDFGDKERGIQRKGTQTMCADGPEGFYQTSLPFPTAITTTA